MKNNFIFLMLFSGSCMAQSFTLTPEATISGFSSEYELVAKGKIVNQGTDPLFRWVRTSKILANGWESSVCDTNACYFPQIDSAEVDIPAGSSSKLYMYFYPDGNEGIGEVEIKLFRIANRSEFRIGKFYANAITSTIFGAKSGLETLILYPNPAKDEVSIQFPFHKGKRIIFDQMGRKVEEKLVNSNLERLNLSGFKSGVYRILALSDIGTTAVSFLVVE